MKLNVLLPSRGRPKRLISAVTLMHQKTSGRHDVSYIIGCDSDDPETIAAVYALSLKVPNVRPYCTVRLPSLGEMANRMAERFPADVYASLPDDVEIITQNWDYAIYASWMQRPDGVWWWHTETKAACPVVSEKWRSAAGGIYTDYFPFWWDDCWLMQVWIMASGGGCLGLPATLEDKAYLTHRMRDLKFWTDFYVNRKEERWQRAEQIAAKLGWPKPQRGEVLGDVNDDFWGRIESIQEKQGDRGEPTQEYLKAKRRAELLMAA